MCSHGKARILMNDSESSAQKAKGRVSSAQEGFVTHELSPVQSPRQPIVILPEMLTHVSCRSTTGNWRVRLMTPRSLPGAIFTRSLVNASNGKTSSNHLRWSKTINFRRHSRKSLSKAVTCNLIFPFRASIEMNDKETADSDDTTERICDGCKTEEFYFGNVLLVQMKHFGCSPILSASPLLGSWKIHPTIICAKSSVTEETTLTPNYSLNRPSIPKKFNLICLGKCSHDI